MEKNDVDEKLIKWNDIFEELVIDANALIKDLWGNINQIAIFGVFMIFIGAIAITILRDLGTKYIVVSRLIFGVWFLFGILLLWKWYRLRQKYNRFRSLQKMMVSE